MFAVLCNEELTKFESKELLLAFIQDKENVEAFALSPLELTKHITYKLSDKHNFQIGLFYPNEGGYFIGNIENEYYFIEKVEEKCKEIAYSLNGIIIHKEFNSILERDFIREVKYWSSTPGLGGSQNFKNGEFSNNSLSEKNSIIPVRVKTF